MKIRILLFFLLASSMHVIAKKYPFDMNHSYEIQVVRVAQKGLKFYKVWGVAGSVDKAMTQALQDAVAASLFTGVAGSDVASAVPALCGSVSAYQDHQSYFDDFFRSGKFLLYVNNVNSQYPSGENNVRTNQGRKVGLYVQVKYDELRKKLEQDGIIKSLKDYF